MKNTFFIIIALVAFQSIAFAQSSFLLNYNATDAPQSLLHNHSNSPKSERGFFNIYLGAGVVAIEDIYGFGGQFDANIHLGKKISLGGLAAVQVIGEDRFTPMAAYVRLNLTRHIGVQGGYGWYMDNFIYDFNTAQNGVYGGLVVGGNRAKLELSGYFPDGENYRLVIGTKIRIFKL